MNFFAVGNLNKYTKNMKMQTKWKQKKESANFAPEEHKTELQRKNDQFKKSYMEQKANDDNNKTLSDIYTKINTGAKLTSEEMQYLQSKDPMAYQRLKSIEAEKSGYDKELKQCKTKDDVKRLRVTKLYSSLAAMNSVSNNPNIPEGTKMGIAAAENAKITEFDKAVEKFIKSGDYNRLPTDAEKFKAEHDLKEAEETERDKIFETDDKISGNEDEVNTEKSVSENNADSADTEVKSAKQDFKMPSDKEMTKAEAENTPEAQKLKRSKAKSAYRESHEFTENDSNAPVFSAKG